ncbi:MAG: hypothetical protein HC871_03135 [Rhizobiales bacterium]|nr:hypothetical protein [Hyphomicrobiales bacterium]
MITQARIDEDLAPAGLDWITAMRAPAIKQLADGGLLQLSLFDQRNLASITSPDYPNERLIVCRNPAPAAERSRKRLALLDATEAELAKIQQAVQRRGQRALRGKAEIGLKVGAVLNKKKVAKHFDLTIEDDRFTFARNAKAITTEAALDGLYVVRTSLPKDKLDDQDAIRAYKSLARAARRSRCKLRVNQDEKSIRCRSVGRA